MCDRLSGGMCVCTRGRAFIILSPDAATGSSLGVVILCFLLPNILFTPRLSFARLLPLAAGLRGRSLVFRATTHVPVLSFFLLFIRGVRFFL